jgi:hypothetical protein
LEVRAEELIETGNGVLGVVVFVLVTWQGRKSQGLGTVETEGKPAPILIDYEFIQ